MFPVKKLVVTFALTDVFQRHLIHIQTLRVLGDSARNICAICIFPSGSEC